VAGVICLGWIDRRISVLNVACNNCDKMKKLSTDRLVGLHGPATSIPDLRRIIAAKCPLRQSDPITDVCGLHFPELPPMFG
jgi:hypothetical protein